MLKKPITFKDLDGNEVTMDFYFHLSKAELIELEIVNQGGLSGRLQRIGESNNGRMIMKEFKDLIRMSYGERSEDNLRFIKSPELSEAFLQTNAYEVLFIELVTDPNAGAAFINGLMPSDVNAAAQNTQSAVPANLQNHPSMQGHLSRKDARQSEAGQPAPETPEQMEARIRAEMEAKYARPQTDIPDTPQY